MESFRPRGWKFLSETFVYDFYFIILYPLASESDFLRTP